MALSDDIASAMTTRANGKADAEVARLKAKRQVGAAEEQVIRDQVARQAGRTDTREYLEVALAMAIARIEALESP